MRAKQNDVAAEMKVALIREINQLFGVSSLNLFVQTVAKEERERDHFRVN